MAVKVKGLREVKKAIAKAGGDVKGALSVALYRKGLQIMAESNKEVPVETGRLRATSFATAPTAKHLWMEIGYGTRYAVFVHEVSTSFHAPPTKWKYLEHPVQRHREGYTEWLARDAWRNFKSGRTVILNSGMSTRPIDPGDEWQRTKRSGTKPSGGST